MLLGFQNYESHSGVIIWNQVWSPRELRQWSVLQNVDYGQYQIPSQYEDLFNAYFNAYI